MSQGSHHPSESGRSADDATGELTFQLSAAQASSQVSHQQLPCSFPFIPCSYQPQQLHPATAHQDSHYQSLMQFRGDRSVTVPSMYYASPVFYPQIQFADFTKASQEQSPLEYSQQPHPNSSSYAGREGTGLARAWSAVAKGSDTSDFEKRNAPGRGVPRSENTAVHIEQPPSLPSMVPPHLKKVEEMKLAKEVNPAEYRDPHGRSRFFVIKSYSEEDVHKAIKYSVWSSSKNNNRTLDRAFSEMSEHSTNSSAASTPSSINEDYFDSGSCNFLEHQPMVYLFFSVNGSGHFCGVARLASSYKENLDAEVWCQDKWTGLFYIRWLYVKDVPNPHLRHIRLPNNDNKPVTNTRDGVEVGYENGCKVLKVIHHFKYTTTLFDDYDHYDRLEEEKNRRKGRN